MTAPTAPPQSGPPPQGNDTGVPELTVQTPSTDCPDDANVAVVDPDGNVYGCFASEDDANTFISEMNGGETPPADQGSNYSADVTSSPFWEGILVVEGVETGDGRMFSNSSLDFAPMPMPLTWQVQTGERHQNAVMAARIDWCERRGSEIWGGGTFDLGSENGREAHRLVGEGFLRGVSIDVDNVKDADVELVFPETLNDDLVENDLAKLFQGPELTIFHKGRIRGATLVTLPAFVEAQIWLVKEPMHADSPMPTGHGGTGIAHMPGYAVETHDTTFADTSWDAGTNVGRLKKPLTVATARKMFAYVDTSQKNSDGTVPLSACKYPHHNVSGDGAVGAANLTGCSAAIGRLHGSSKGLSADEKKAVYNHVAAHLRKAGKTPPPLQLTFEEVNPLTAASHVVTISDRPPASWFDEPTDVLVDGALTVTDEGRVFGYLAPAGIAHRSFGDRRVEVPLRNVDYTNFMGGQTIAQRGNELVRLTTGCITMDCGHAGMSSDAHGASEHYDNTCSIVATIRVGENRSGVWVAGALVPGVSGEQIARMMACRLSGDWRPHREKPGMRELTAALLVPVPGFPMARASLRVDGGQLVASAVPVRFERTTSLQRPAPDPTVSRRRAVEFIAKSIGRDRASRLAELRARVHQEG